MSAWHSLSETVAGLLADRPRVLSSSLRVGAAELAAATVGESAARANPAWLNVAGLALSMPRLEVHQLTADAVGQVHATDLRTLPGEPSRLLRRGWLVETKRPERGHLLFGKTACLGGYPLDDAIFLVGLGYPDGITVARWVPRWRERELEIPEDWSPEIDDRAAHREWAIAAARFAVTLGLLLEAHGSPLVVDERIQPGRRLSREAVASGWIVRRVHLDRPAGSHGGGEGSGAAGTDGRLGVEVAVRGHVKRQAYGPGHELRRWIYVASYEARRWLAPRPLRVDVDR